MARLGDICTIVSGSTPKSNVPEYWDGDIKWITPAELDQGTYIINDSVRHITELGVAKTGLKPFPQGTVILSSRAPIGKTAIAGCEMYCNQGFKNLICSDKINPRYLYWFLTCNTEYLNSLGRGATFKEISKEIVANIEIPLPALEQQISVAEKFEKISELIALRKEQLVKLDQLVKSRFIELFGDEQQFLTKACNQVSDVCESKVGIVIQPTQYYTEDTNNSVKAFRSLNIKPFRVNDTDWVYFTVESNNLMQRTQVHTNDVAVVRSGVNLGDSCVIPPKFDGCNAIDILILTPKSCILPIYLSAFINYPCGKNQIINVQRGGALKHLNNKQLQDAQIYLPPIELQQQFATFVEQTDKSKLAIQQSLDKLELLKKSLMQEYFG